MTDAKSGRAHLIAGGFPPGSMGGHDHDYARLKLLGLLAEREVPASVANDFADVEKWLPVSQLLITYVAGPYPNAAQTEALRSWLESGGKWLALHGTSGGRAERVEGVRMRRTLKTEHHALLGSFFLTHPPICEFRAEIRDPNHPLTRGVGTSFTVEDEPYFIELQDPGSTTDPADRGLRRAPAKDRRSARSTRATPRCRPTARPGSSATPRRWAKGASPITRSATAIIRRSAPLAPLPIRPTRPRRLSVLPGRAKDS